LMGFDPNADLDDVGPIATLSFRLVITNTPSEGEHGDGPLSPEEEREVSNKLITHCEAKVEELNEALQNCPDPNIARYQYSDEVCVDLSAGAMQLYRYETTLDRILRTTISQLIQLEKTGLSHGVSPNADSFSRNCSGVSLRNSQKLKSGTFNPSRPYGV
jgi:hypothetical protein